MNILLRLLQRGRKYWGYIAVALVSMVLLTAVQLISPKLIQELIGMISRRDADLAQNALRIAFLLALTYAGQWIFGFLRSYIAHLAAWRFVSDLRVSTYKKLQELSLGFYHDKQTGQILARVANDTAEMEVLIAHAVPDLIISILTLAGVMAILLAINLKLALYTFVTIPVFTYLAVKFATRVRPQFKAAHEIRGQFYALLNDNIQGMREIQAFNRQDYELGKVQEKSHSHIFHMLKALKLSAFFHPTMNFVAQLGTVIVVGAGGAFAAANRMAVEDIVAFMLYLNMFYNPISTLARLNEDLQNALAAGQRVFDILDSEPDVKEKENAVDAGRLNGDITFENVDFSYENGRPIIKDFSLDIKAGEMVAFVGHTGVGKTTLASLMNRFYEQQSGTIRFDGTDIRDITLKSLRDNISMVMQDIYLFNGTVAENIAYGAEAATKEQIMEAAKKANADEFIERLSDGYETVVGERGVKLSGGQKQRLAIARAILRDTPILILDEATSAVDMGTEKLIHEAIDIVAKNRTTITIAHRLATVKNADRIVVLEEGRIAEIGTHEELIKKGGLYSRFCAMQFEG